eukprot:5083419-Pleurochrysis_carterae.AAC.3
MWSRSRTGGGPPSGTSAVKNLLTAKVEQGGDATTAAYTLKRSARGGGRMRIRGANRDGLPPVPRVIIDRVNFQ